MDGKTFYYARVSSADQNLARQLEAFYALGATDREIIRDTGSGKDLNRPGYTALKTVILRPGDTLVIKSLDRLSRSKADIKRELEYFRENHIRLKVLDLPTTMLDLPAEQAWITDMVNNLLIEVLATMAEQERMTIRARQAEGIAAEPINGEGKRVSSRTGRPHGRPETRTPPNWDTVMHRWKAGEITAVAAMEATGLKKTTFYKIAKKE